MLRFKTSIPQSIEAYVATSLLLPPVSIPVIPILAKSGLDRILSMTIAISASIIWVLQFIEVQNIYAHYLSAFVLMIGVHSLQWLDLDVDSILSKSLLNLLLIVNVFLSVKYLFPAGIEYAGATLVLLLIVAAVQTTRSAFRCKNIYDQVFEKNETTGGGEYIVANIALLAALLFLYY